MHLKRGPETPESVEKGNLATATGFVEENHSLHSPVPAPIAPGLEHLSAGV